MEQGSAADRGAAEAPPPLFGAQDPDPVITLNADGRSSFLLTGDHAGNRVPEALRSLGLPDHERERHIAWDIGVMALGTALSAHLDAAFIAQRYSRLVVDCNRDPASQEAMPSSSDGTVIPGNLDMTEAMRQQRIGQIHSPYQAAIAASLSARAERAAPTILIALHSFTPVMGGVSRPWEAGILHSDGRIDFARALLVALRVEGNGLIGDNEPYRMDATDYTVPRHAFARILPYAEIEVRQDLIDDEAGVAVWAGRLASALRMAAAAIDH